MNVPQSETSHTQTPSHCLTPFVSPAIIVVFDLSSVSSLAHARYGIRIQLFSLFFFVLSNYSHERSLAVSCLSLQAVAGGRHEGERPVQCFTVPRRYQERPQCGWNELKMSQLVVFFFCRLTEKKCFFANILWALTNNYLIITN